MRSLVFGSGFCAAMAVAMLDRQQIPLVALLCVLSLAAFVLSYYVKEQSK